MNDKCQINSLDKYAKKIVDLPKFLVLSLYRDTIKLMQEGKNIYHLQLGQPGGGAPKRVIKAAKSFLDNDKVGYTEAIGTQQLRQEISNWYKKTHDLEIKINRIVVTMGSSGAFILCYKCCFEEGAVIASSVPGYPCYRHVVNILGYKSLEIKTTSKTDFKLTTSHINEAYLNQGKFNALVIGNPANPTGSIYSKNELLKILELCNELKVRLIVDEVYHGLTYGTSVYSMAGKEDTIVINSFSKYFCMPGWRIGWMVIPDTMTPLVEKASQNLFISPSSLAQHAAYHAFKSIDELEEKRKIYQLNRQDLIDAMPDTDFCEYINGTGALYIYARLRENKTPALKYTQDLLNVTGVAITPGNDFDPYHGSRWVRISFCVSRQDMQSAIAGFRHFAKINQKV